MATDQRNLPAYLSNDADFRSWGSGIAAQLAAVGLVQTADTGQVNWSTVTRPSAATDGGYEIWRFNDALQATLPIYIRIDFGVAATQDRPRLKFTVGTGSNGSGTINGQAGTAVTGTNTSSKTAGVTLPSYCSHTAGQFALVSGVDNASPNYTHSAIIERSHDATGAATADGILTAIGPGATITKQVIPPTGTVPGTSTTTGAIWPSPTTGQSTSAGGNVSLGIGTFHCNGKLNFSRTLTYRHSDIGELSTFTTSFMGATRTYMPMGDGPNITGLPISSDATAIPWE